MPWNWTARYRARTLLLAMLPDIAWVFVALGSVLWGAIAPRVLPGDACSGAHSMFVAVVVQLGLLGAAIALTLVRGAYYRMEGGIVVVIAGAISLLSAGVFLMAWLMVGTCWSSFTF